MYNRKMKFSIIKQIVHVVEGNIENFHPSKNHCQPRSKPRLTKVLSGWLPSTIWTIYIISFTVTTSPKMKIWHFTKVDEWTHANVDEWAHANVAVDLQLSIKVWIRLSRERSLSCHTCFDMGPRFSRSHPKDRPIQSPLKTRKEMRRTYSYPDTHGYCNIIVHWLHVYCILVRVFQDHNVV
jgi:hypothetical protein